MAKIHEFPPRARPTIIPKPFTFFEQFEEGRKRKMVFDINTLADFEQLTGMGFSQLMNQKAVFAVARAMVFSGLKRHDRALTLERIGDLIFQYLKESRDNTIDTLLSFCFEVAVEQGALQRMEDDTFSDSLLPEKNEPSGDVIDVTPEKQPPQLEDTKTTT